MILAVNLGSSSIKFAAFDAAEPPLRKLVNGARPWSCHEPGSLEDAAGGILHEVEDALGPRVVAMIGHRIVHGGGLFTGPVRINDDVLRTLEGLCSLAPLHQPFNLAAVRAFAAIRAGIPQSASFDTAFHSTAPAVATRFALPSRYREAGVRRYGFHGLSYDHIASRLALVEPQRARGRVLAAHLGAGASLCAMRGGASLDTTMGFSTLDGLVMATRCGALDPGVVLHLLQRESPAAITDLLHRRSGLLGVSGISADMRDLLASPEPAAQEAVELYLYRAGREAGGLVGILGGVDAMVFTGGVGENAPLIRSGLCERLAWLGVSLDPVANEMSGERRIDTGVGPAVWVIPADEEAVVARDALAVISGL